MSEEELLDAMCQAYWKAGPGIRNPMRSILELLHAHGYRRCAEGQRVTQWCDRAEEAEAEVERLRKDYHHACATVAQLYAAATGRHGEGPLRGVIEDAAAVCSERDALRAEVERLREALVDLVGDICDREDMDDPSVNPGRRRCVAAARAAIDAARGES